MQKVLLQIPVPAYLKKILDIKFVRSKRLTSEVEITPDTQNDEQTQV